MDFDKEKIIESARKRLPYTTECKANNYIIPIAIEDVYDQSSSAFEILEKPFFYQVTFRKQVVNDVIVGWEFVNIE